MTKLEEKEKELQERIDNENNLQSQLEKLNK